MNNTTSAPYVCPSNSPQKTPQKPRNRAPGEKKYNTSHTGPADPDNEALTGQSGPSTNHSHTQSTQETRPLK